MEPLLTLKGLRVSAARRPRLDALHVFDLQIEIDAPPFGGLLKTMVTADDLTLFQSSLQAMQIPGRVLFGGGRAVLLRFEVGAQIGGKDDQLALEVVAAPSEDDPWPKLSFLIFDVSRSFAATAAHSIETFLSHPTETTH